MRSFASVTVFMLLLAGILVGWNANRFFHAKAKIRANDLNFLPSPVAAKLLCLGHANSVAKLRWIDSFSYFQYQLDRKDDTIQGQAGTSGFFRLYDTLTSLDPNFQAFYEHASLNFTIISRPHLALSFLERGLFNLPKSTALWRQTAAALKVNYNWEINQPASMAAFLASWETSESTDIEKRQVMDWMKSLGGRTFKGLEQLPYWLDRLQSHPPGTTLGDYIEATIRTQLIAFGVRELNGLLQLYRENHQPDLVDFSANLLDPGCPFSDLFRLGGCPADLRELLAVELLTKKYARQLPPLGPIRVGADGKAKLLPDPFGFPWAIKDRRIYSLGDERRSYLAWLGQINGLMEKEAQKRGTWPRSLDEVKDWGFELRPVPGGGTLRWEDKSLVVDLIPPAGEPWRLRN